MDAVFKAHEFAAVGDLSKDRNVTMIHSKGTLEAGKLADLAILDRNPLTVDPMAIKDIKVLETIKEGQTICRQ